jgi:hypothetical protein
MGPADEVQIATKKALPEYAASDFEKNFPAWKKLVESGKKTATDLLAMLSTKATFSEQQKAGILELNMTTANKDDSETRVDAIANKEDEAQ